MQFNTGSQRRFFDGRWIGAVRFDELLSRYAPALVGVIMQSTACNVVHGVEQRPARWLLMAHDRIRTDAFPRCKNSSR